MMRFSEREFIICFGHSASFQRDWLFVIRRKRHLSLLALLPLSRQ